MSISMSVLYIENIFIHNYNETYQIIDPHLILFAILFNMRFLIFTQTALVMS
jgi:hypothetical protein